MSAGHSRAVFAGQLDDCDLNRITGCYDSLPEGRSAGLLLAPAAFEATKAQSGV
jgi:hypothetical protein